MKESDWKGARPVLERERLGSRLGFILISAGCAIGIGNVWKFPYVAGQYGGGVFLLFYLLFLVILGLPVMTMEFAIGRAAQTSPAHIFRRLEPKGSHWHWYTPFMLAGNWLLMMFYTVVSGWMLRYFLDMLTGQFEGASQGEISEHYAQMLADPWSLVLFTVLVIVVGFVICARGVQKGLEKVTKVMMTALLVIMVVLVVNAMFSPGAGEGIRYLLYPDLERARQIGLMSVISAAMNQAFFTLSLGIGAMAIFGSYIGRQRALFGESLHVAALDTFVAITAGLIVIPSCFAYGVEPSAGPGLIFVSLPNIFAGMPAGRIWGSLFFLFLSFAAFSTILAVFENILSSTMDLTGWSRRKTALVCALCMIVLSLPCALGFNVLGQLAPLGAGITIMDLEDFLVSGLLLPLGSLVMVLFCTWKLGWGWKAFTQEADTGTGLKVPGWIRGYCKYLLPLIILVILISGLPL